MTDYATLLGFEIVGAMIALYLVWKRRTAGKPVCVIGDDCGVVLESKYNNIFRVAHNDVMGLLYYVAMITLVNLLMFDLGPTGTILLAIRGMAATGAGMGLFFMFVQWRLIKAWCFWCILSNLNTWIIAGLVFKLI